MSPAIQKKLQEFRRNEKLQARFWKLVERVSLEDLLWPEEAGAVFGQAFKVRGAGKVPYPLLDVELQLESVERKIFDLCREEGSAHPALAYYHLFRFEERFRAPGDRKTKARIRSLKAHLGVSPKMLRARSEEALRKLLLAELGGMTKSFSQLSARVGEMEAEREVFRNPAFLHPHHRRTIETLQEDRDEMRRQVREASLLREAHADEKRHLGELLTMRNSQSVEYERELDGLRRELEVLSRKCDALVSKNIELSNRLSEPPEAAGLGEILDGIRDRINSALREGVEKGDDWLLKNIRAETDQLERARVYLGRAFYDMGILHFRLGDREKAVAQLRAARELGVDGAEADHIINSG